MGINPPIPLWVPKINEPTVAHKDGLEPDKVRDGDPQMGRPLKGLINPKTDSFYDIYIYMYIIYIRTLYIYIYVHYIYIYIYVYKIMFRDCLEPQLQSGLILLGIFFATGSLDEPRVVSSIHFLWLSIEVGEEKSMLSSSINLFYIYIYM